MRNFRSELTNLLVNKPFLFQIRLRRYVSAFLIDSLQINTFGRICYLQMLPVAFVVDNNLTVTLHAKQFFFNSPCTAAKMLTASGN